MQRELIAATTMLADNAPANAMQDLATARARSAISPPKGNAALQTTGADPAAIAALARRNRGHGQAESSLNSGNRPASLDAEGLALASLYQASHALPSSPSPSGGSGELQIKLDDGWSARRATTANAKAAFSSARAGEFTHRRAAGPRSQKRRAGSGRRPGRRSRQDKAERPRQGRLQRSEPGSKRRGRNLAQHAGPRATTRPSSAPSRAALAAQAHQLADFLNKAAASDPAVSHGMAGSAGKAAGEMEIAAGEFKRGAVYDRPKVSSAQRASIEALESVQDYLKNTIAAEDHGTSAQDERSRPNTPTSSPIIPETVHENNAAPFTRS